MGGWGDFCFRNLIGKLGYGYFPRLGGGICGARQYIRFRQYAHPGWEDSTREGYFIAEYVVI